MSFLLKAAIRYMTDTQYRYNPLNAEKNSKIIYGVGNFNKLMLFPVCMIIEACVGTFYAWAGLNHGMVDLLNKDEYNINIIFYVCVLVFGFSSCLTGPWLERNGPVRPGILGAVLFFTGNMLSAIALGIKSYPLLLVGYGVFCGAGIGMSYLVPVAVLQKWFPKYRGLASGLAVGAFGFGSFIAAYVNETLVSSYKPGQGMEFMWFLVPGCAYFFIQALLTPIMRFPPPENVAATNAQTEKSAQDAEKNQVSSPKNGLPETAAKSEKFIRSVLSFEFWIIFFIFFFSVIPGLMFVSKISKLSNLALKKQDDQEKIVTPKEEVDRKREIVIAVNAIWNVLGRAVFGLLSDKIGRIIPLVVACVGSLVFVHFLADCFREGKTNFTYFQWMAWGITVCYGASVGLVPGFLGECFGGDIVGALYGIALLAWSISGMLTGLWLSKFIADQTPSSFITVRNILYATSFVALGLIGAFVALRHWRKKRVACASGNNGNKNQPMTNNNAAEASESSNKISQSQKTVV